MSQFSPSDNKSELYENYANGDEDAKDEVAKRDIMNNIANTEITPYLSIGLGKETMDGSPLSVFTTLTFTSKSIYFTAGSDLTLSSPSILLGPSISISAGLFSGPSSGIEGYGYGLGGGSFLGVTGSSSVNYFRKGNGLQISNGTTKSYV